MMKRCSRCKQIKDRESCFYGNKRTYDGYQTWCAECYKVGSNIKIKSKSKPAPIPDTGILPIGTNNELHI